MYMHTYHIHTYIYMYISLCIYIYIYIYIYPYPQARLAEEARLVRLQLHGKTELKLLSHSKTIPQEDIASVHKSQAKMAELRQRKAKLVSQFEVERGKDELKIKRMLEDHQAALEHRMQKLQDWMKTNQDMLRLSQQNAAGPEASPYNILQRPASSSSLITARYKSANPPPPPLQWFTIPPFLSL
jgi:hypothetical protein